MGVSKVEHGADMTMTRTTFCEQDTMSMSLSLESNREGAQGARNMMRSDKCVLFTPIVATVLVTISRGRSLPPKKKNIRITTCAKNATLATSQERNLTTTSLNHSVRLPVRSSQCHFKSTLI